MNFEVGDWVTHGDDTCQVLDTRKNEIKVKLKGMGTFFVPKQKFKLWKPKKGEWCWFVNIQGSVCLKRFLQMCPIVETNFISEEGLISGKVEPFIGSLPSFLK